MDGVTQMVALGLLKKNGIGLLGKLALGTKARWLLVEQTEGRDQES